MIWSRIGRVYTRHNSHLHHTNEILLALSDGGTEVIRGKRYPLKKGDLFFLYSGSPHHLEATEKCPAQICYICFDPHHLTGRSFAQSGGILEYLMHLGISRLRGYEKPYDEMVLHIHDELQSGCPYSDQYASVELSKLLISVYRDNNTDGKEFEHNKNRLAEVIRFMDAEPEKPFRLNQAARRALMGRSAFTEHFRHATGMSFTRYQREARVKRAVHLLRETDATVSEIALDCGFENEGYFYRSFKFITGFSPGKYREASKITASWPPVV